MKNTLVKGLASAALFALLAACGGGGAGGGNVKTPPKPGPQPPRPTIDQGAQEQFNRALDAFIAHDKANDWSDAACAEVAKEFDAAVGKQSGGKFAEATFNAGLAYQRCGDDKNARAKFEKALADDPKFHGARAQIALYKYKADGNEDAAINELQQAVLDAQFQNVPALVNLAMVQMVRDGEQGQQGCKNDMDCAKLNLQRALAIDDAYMPAFNQLALYYFQLAKKRAGATAVKGKGSRGRQIVTNAAKTKRASVQELELAALVCSQAIRKNPNYAPIHNTAGLIQNELGQVNGAVAEFAAAAKLDPKLFEAQMNYAAVNLSFRGFDVARDAYKKALAMRPNDYDAHLGLALALRGPITGTETNYDELVNGAQAELDAAKKIDAARPDAYYNEGILTQEFRAKAGGSKDQTIAALTKAKGIFQQFIDKASGKPEYDGAVKRSKERMQDIDDTIQFLNLEVKEEPKEAPKDAPKEEPKK